MSLGGDQSWMAFNFVRSILMAPGEISKPRYSTSVVLKAHLESFRARCCLCSCSRTRLVHSW